MINSWQEFLKIEKEKDYYKKIVEFVIEERKQYTVYPNDDEIFNAFRLTPLDKVKIVICGMDPYINGEAHGLAFSIKDGFKLAPSLKNVFKELKDDLGIENTRGDLSSWAQQGVLLLNSILTVRAGESNSHKKLNWEYLTNEAFKLLNEREQPIVFALWGNHAKSKKKFITNQKHLILEGGHPSFFSCHLYFGGKYFSKINEFLKKNGIDEIDWKT